MDQAGLSHIRQFISKYTYVILILGLGIILMLIPVSGKSESSAHAITIAPDQKEHLSLQDQLSNLLSQLDGAGKVRVLLTEATGEKKIFQTNTDVSSGEHANSERADTVVLTDSNRNQAGLVRQIDPPTYLGAVVLCQGAEKASVRLAITEAVSNATGLGYNKITVLKMK